MEEFIRYLKIATKTIILICTSFSFIVITIAYLSILLKISFRFDGDIMAFFGAIIGGSITLIGVLLTIKYSENIRKKENIPKSLHHLEKAIDYLEIEIESLEVKLRPNAFFAKEKEGCLININEKYIEKKTDLYYRLTREVVNEIKGSVIFVDSKTYKLFIDFKRGIESAYGEVFNKAESEYLEFNEELYYAHPEILIDGFDEKYHALQAELEKRLQYLKQLYLGCDTKLLLKIHELYSDLKWELDIHQINLQNKADY